MSSPSQDLIRESFFFFGTLLCPLALATNQSSDGYLFDRLAEIKCQFK